jgi:Flp pilus assembly protein TadD
MTFTKHQCVLLLILTTVTAYLNCVPNRFVWDDELLIEDNNYIRNSTYVGAAFTTDLFHKTGTGAAYYRPLQTVSYMVNYFFGGLNPSGYHVVNILCHIGCVLLLWGLIRQLSGDNVVALLVAALFAIHPVNTNAITYIAGRADPLAFLFLLVSLTLFLEYRIRSEDRVLLRTAFFAGSALAFVAAMFSRESAMVFPVLLFLYCFTYTASDEKRARNALVATTPFLLLVAAFLAWRYMVLAQCHKVLLLSLPMPAWLVWQVPFRTLATDFGLLLWPAHLQMERQVILGGVGLLALTGIGLVITAGLLWALGRTYRAQPLAFFGLCWFVATMLPILAIPQIAVLAAEHWLYVPSVGLYLALVAVCHHQLNLLQPRPRALVSSLAVVVCVAALTALAARTIWRNADWVTPVTFYSRTKQAAPYSTRVRNNLGREYSAIGERQRALEELLTAMRVSPEDLRHKGNLAVLYLSSGELDKAEALSQEMLRVEPFNTGALLCMADIYDQRGDFAGARLEYLRSAASSVEVSPRLQFGAFLLNHGRFSEAIQVATEAHDIEPGHAQVFNLLGAALTGLGQDAKAEEAFRMAIKLDRHSANGFVNLGRAEFNRGDVPAAIAHYHRALRIRPEDGHTLYRLGAAYWRLGNSRAAIQKLERAQQLLPDNRMIRDALEDARHGKPYTPPAPAPTPHQPS